MPIELSNNHPAQPAEARDDRRPLRVCMLVYAFYESDTRVQQYATALAKRADIVDVIALKRDAHLPDFMVLNGVNVYRIQTRTVNEGGQLSYLSRILRFLWRAFFRLMRKHRQHPYDVVHVHNVPDFLVFAAAYPKWKHVPIILDIHDLLPELYASKFKASSDSLLFRLTKWLERWSAGFANHVIVANHLWRDRLAARSSVPEKCSVVRNYPDFDIFFARETSPEKNSGRFVLTYPGTLNKHQGVDIAIRAFASIADKIPDTDFHIYGEGAAKPCLIELTNQLGMQDRVVFHDFLPSREVARVMAETDLAIEPKRSNSAFGNEALSTKILEFMALKVPVVASRTKIHAYYYDDSLLKYYDNDDETELARHIVTLRNDPDLRRRLVENAQKYVSRNNWDAQKGEYLQLVDSLVANCRRAR